MPLSEDLKPEWMNVMRRLQSVAKSKGLAILSIQILVDSEGVPVAWTNPERKLIEPKRLTDEILKLLMG